MCNQVGQREASVIAGEVAVYIGEQGRKPGGGLSPGNAWLGSIGI